MKTILLPTDFEKHSEKAMAFAIQLAKKANAKIIVLNCFQLPDINEELSGNKTDFYREQKEQAEKSLKDYCRLISLEKSDNGNNIQSEFVAEQNIPSIEILKLAKEKEVELIIMGVHDEKHLLRLTETTALHVIKDSSCPVLIVNENTTPKSFDKINFAVQDIKQDLKKIKQLIPISRLYNSEISIFHVDEKAEGIDTLEKVWHRNEDDHSLLNQIIQEYKHTPKVHFHYNFSDEALEKKNPELSMDEPDLVVLNYHESCWIENIFHKQIIKNLIEHNNTPLLILHW